MYGEYNHAVIAGEDLSGQDIDGTYIDVIFRRCDFTNARIIGEFIRCRFESNCTCVNTIWDGEFSECSGLWQTR